MEDALEAITRGNVAEVKIVLASIAAALAVYQVALMAVGYGKLRLPLLAAAPASAAHRAAGDAIAVLTIVVATMCITVFGFSEDDASAHVVLACALLAVFAFKVVVVRWWHALGRLLPALGITLLVLFWATWATAAAEYVLG
jgi:hypothetical protein